MGKLLKTAKIFYYINLSMPFILIYSMGTWLVSMYLFQSLDIRSYFSQHHYMLNFFPYLFWLLILPPLVLAHLTVKKFPVTYNQKNKSQFMFGHLLVITGTALLLLPYWAISDDNGSSGIALAIAVNIFWIITLILWVVGIGLINSTKFYTKG